MDDLNGSTAQFELGQQVLIRGKKEVWTITRRYWTLGNQITYTLHCKGADCIAPEAVLRAYVEKAADGS